MSEPRPEGGAEAPRELELVTSISALPRSEWDALDPGQNPFTSHDFLSSLEDSGSVGGSSGWTTAALVMRGAGGALAAALPGYVKTHSQGEYVFDHGWAEAYERAGGDYYPKYQISVPFTPATGPRLLTRDPQRDGPMLIRGAEVICERLGLSSAHATFIEPSQQAIFEQAGWGLRRDIQFHWQNNGYASFDEFLGTLASRKRKAVRKERASAQDGLTIHRLTGAGIKPQHWDIFWEFYQDTGARKWGQPYLTREAFTLFGERIADKILLVLAEMDGAIIAGALNFFSPTTLYGRYWGALLHKPNLHFELCYYQAIDFAIERRLTSVEAGAQGGHKLARGYEPVQTISAHYVADPALRAAVESFLVQEARGIEYHAEQLSEHLPFRRGNEGGQ